ncbi:MAG TPA: hypothetical protein VHS78_07495 [Candidatus Elarobacter sp.]|nr:hypothetical protein [Candidatus Elarobacter sp.]
MTINLLTAVQDDGLVMCADSMLTLTGNHPLMGSDIVTTFENAEKIIELGSNLPAAAMISGAADIQGKLVSSFLKDASRAIDADDGSRNAIGIVDKVFSTINLPYQKLLDAIRAQAASIRSQTDQLGEINERRKSQNLPPLTEVRPEQIAIKGEPNPPPDPVEEVTLVPLTIVVCSYFGTPSATELVWPDGRRREVVPGSPLWWWGSGGSAVARLVRGFDYDLLQSHEAAGVTPGSAEAKAVLEYAESYAVAYTMPTPVESMPLQDAIEFTEYLGQVACRYDRFKMGPAGVGGPLDVLVLRDGERHWVRRKRIHSGDGTR